MTSCKHVWVNDWAKYYGVDNGGWVVEFEERPNRSLELWYSEEGKSKIVGFVALEQENDWRDLYGEKKEEGGEE